MTGAAGHARADTNGRQRIIVDITPVLLHLRREVFLTGLQRVALTVSRCLREYTDYDLCFVWFDKSKNTFVEFEDHESLFDMARMLGWIRQKKYYVNGRKLERYADRPAKLACHLICSRLTRYFHMARHALRGVKLKTIVPRSGDIFLFLLSNQGLKELELVDVLKKQLDVKCICVVHDLIPLKTETGVKREIRVDFQRWLSKVAATSDAVLTVSDYTKADVRDCLSMLQLRQPPCLPLPLAHQFMPWDSLAGPDARAVMEEARPFILSVGPQTGRKNGIRLVEAWRHMAARLPEHACPQLVLAGCSTSDVDLLRAIDGAAPRPVLLAKPSDTDLARLYRAALFSVYPSLYEGWGLPVGESLWFGTPCAASATTSIPEVGGHFVEYFDPHDVTSMADCIRRLTIDDAFREARRAALARMEMRSWAHTTAYVEAAIRHISAPGAAATPYYEHKNAA